MSGLTTKRLDAALLVLRAIVGSIFIAHGAQKIFVFGLGGVSSSFGQLGIPVPGVAGPLVALLEFFGGIALVLGLLTRLASLGLAFNMLGAILLVHLPAGFFNPAGFEFPLALLGTTVALTLAGAGKWSLDEVLVRRRSQLAPVIEGRVLRKAA